MEKYAGDILLPGLTLADLYKLRHINAVPVPAEEFVLHGCYYKRAVLIGDAFQKMNPLTGHGGNLAIESVAMLADLLKEAMDRGNSLDDTTIHCPFSKFQSERGPRTRSLMQAAQMVQCIEALDSPFLKFLNFNVLSKASREVILVNMATNVTPCRILRYIPLERNKGRLALDSQVQVSPRQRSTLVTLCWVTSMLIISFPSSVLAWPPRFYHMANPGTLLCLEAYSSMMAVITNSLWVVESYRWGILLTPLCSAIPFALASIIFGRAIIIPMYFAIHIYASRDGSFYYPSPRAINVWIEKSLPVCFVAAYALPFMQVMVWIRYSDCQRVPATSWSTLSMAHLIIPLVLRLGERFQGKSQPEISPVELVYGSYDVAYLSWFFTLLQYLASASHLVFTSSLWSLYKAGELWNPLDPTVAEAANLSLSILAWCYFVLWDLRRVNIMQASVPTSLTLVLLGSVLLGPAATLAALWKWREGAMEACRKRM